MTPEEQAEVDRKLKEVAEILYRNTPDEELVTFETIELSVREQLLKTVAPKIGDCLGARSLDEFYSSGSHRFFIFSSRNKCRKKKKNKKLYWSSNYLK